MTDVSAPPRHSLAEIQSAIEAIMSRQSGGKTYDASLAAQIAGNIHGAVNDPKTDFGALAGNPAFERMVTEQAPKLAETMNDPAARVTAARAEQARANTTGAPLSEAARVALGLNRIADARGDGAGSGHGLERASSASYSRELSASSTYKELASEGYNATQVTSALNYAKSIGINDNAYAGYFVGSSQATRDAIAAHLKHGKAITDEQVKKPEDVAAIIGAVKSGKMKPEEAPPSVRKILEDMKKDGVDPATADPKSVRKYLQEHPKALDVAKKEANADLAAKANKTDAEIQAESKKLEEKRGAAPDKKPGDKPATPKKPPRAASTL
jgi:hypothetical protein